jgi:hypothetical protein
MTHDRDYLIKSAILSVKLMIPQNVAAAMASGMNQQSMSEPSDHEPEGFVEMPVFDPMSALRRKKRRQRAAMGRVIDV